MPPGARRLFVALAPDPSTRARLAAAADHLRASLGPAGGGYRFAAPPSLHLTLRFLGDVEASRLDAVARAVRQAAAAAPLLSLEVRGAVGFPDPDRPKILALEVAGDLGRLGALVAGLQDRLAAAGFPPEPRPWRPHLTVARRRGRAHLGPWPLPAVGGAPAIAWAVHQVTLFESHLAASGARHEPMLVAPLGCEP